MVVAIELFHLHFLAEKDHMAEGPRRQLGRQCRATKEAQIRRHNWVCNSIRDRMLSVGDEQPPTVLTEHRVSVHGEELRPDLVIIRGHQDSGHSC